MANIHLLDKYTGSQNLKAVTPLWWGINYYQLSGTSIDKLYKSETFNFILLNIGTGLKIYGRGTYGTLKVTKQVPSDRLHT